MMPFIFRHAANSLAWGPNLIGCVYAEINVGFCFAVVPLSWTVLGGLATRRICAMPILRASLLSLRFSLRTPGNSPTMSLTPPFASTRGMNAPRLELHGRIGGHLRDYGFGHLFGLHRLEYGDLPSCPLRRDVWDVS